MGLNNLYARWRSYVKWWRCMGEYFVIKSGWRQGRSMFLWFYVYITSKWGAKEGSEADRWDRKRVGEQKVTLCWCGGIEKATSENCRWIDRECEETNLNIDAGMSKGPRKGKSDWFVEEYHAACGPCSEGKRANMETVKWEGTSEGGEI